jgi:hypothetical protein
LIWYVLVPVACPFLEIPKIYNLDLDKKNINEPLLAPRFPIRIV